MLLYFNGIISADAGDVGNWWQDPSFTIPADALPQPTDDVEIHGSMGPPSTSPVSYHNFRMGSDGTVSEISVIVSGLAIIDGVGMGFAISGTTHFVNGAIFVGSVEGTATFFDSSFSEGGTVTGDAYFLGTSTNDGGTVTGRLYSNGSLSGKNFNLRLQGADLGTFGSLGATGLPSGGSSNVFDIPV